MFLSRTASTDRQPLGVRLLALLIAAAPACSPSVAPDAPDAAPAVTPDASQQNQDPDPTTSCRTDVADFIYFVARQGNASALTLYQFAPATLQLTALGPLSCPDIESSIASVSVDRNGSLWLVHPMGAIYRAPLTGGACTVVSGTDIEPLSDYYVSSAAFAADAAGSDAESLYSISNRTTSEPTQFRHTQATLETTLIAALNPAQSPIADAAGWGRIPILTGTGDGRLFSLSLPDGNAGLTKLAQIDRTTGLQTGTPRQFASEFSGSNSAAFAFWGGDFWLFTHHEATADTNHYLQLVVTRYRTQASTASVVATFGDIRPLGAGVSTCAPVVLL